MHFSIAPVELTTRMQRQFGDMYVTPSNASAPTTPRSGLRHRVSVMLRGLANTLEPGPTPLERS